MQYKTRLINVELNNVKQKMTFEQIAKLAEGKPTCYYIGDSPSAMARSNSIEDFAQKFLNVFYKEYEHRTFKINIQYDGVWFWEVKPNTKEVLKALVKEIELLEDVKAFGLLYEQEIRLSDLYREVLKLIKKL
jgi:hypothetical protein